MKIFLGADHRGFKLKESLKPWLLSLGHEVIDKGNAVFDPDDDFPDFAAAVSEELIPASLSPDKALGILFCGSGGGMALAANKFKGVYAVAVRDQDDLNVNGGYGINVIALPAGKINFHQAQEIILAWLNFQTRTSEKYRRRLKKISKIIK